MRELVLNERVSIDLARVSGACRCERRVGNCHAYRLRNVSFIPSLREILTYIIDTNYVPGKKQKQIKDNNSY
jgi:hypothetical protein